MHGQGELGGTGRRVGGHGEEGVYNTSCLVTDFIQPFKFSYVVRGVQEIYLLEEHSQRARGSHLRR